MSEKLKPCPFCKHAGYAGQHTHSLGKFIVRCGSSGENCPFFPSSGPIDNKDLNEYIKVWNRRLK